MSGSAVWRKGPPAGAGAQAPVAAWAERAEACRRRIGQFAGTSEAEFVSFSGALQECLERAQRAAGRAAEAAAIVVDAETRGNLARFREYAAELERHGSAGREVAARMGEMLTATAAGLAEVPRFGRAFQQSVRCLRALGISTHVEGVRLREGRDQFVQLSADVQQLAEQIAVRFGEVVGRTQALEKKLAATLAAVRQGSEREREEMEAALGQLAAGIARVEELNHTAAGVSAELVTRSQEISERVLHVLASLQFQDITRQRLEHVCESLDVLVEGLGSPDGAEGEAAALVAAVARLQQTQLERAAAEFSQAVEGILDSIASLEAGAEAMEEAMGRLGGGAADDDTLLERLRRPLSAVAESLREGARRSGAIARTLASSGHTTSDVTQHIEGIEEIGLELELIAVNAVVKSSHTGAEGRPLAVIAKEIQRQSELARRVSARVSAQLAHIGEEAAALQTLAQEVTQTTQAGGEGIAASLDETLDSLRVADARFRREMSGLRSDGAALRGALRDCRTSLALHHRLREVAETVGASLEELAAQARALQGEAGGGTPKSVLEALASQYTMESQRRIHRMLMEASEPDTPTVSVGENALESDSGLGENVELF